MSIDSIAVLIALVAGLSLLAYLDRHFARRRSIVANSRYVERIRAARWDSRVHWSGAETRCWGDSRLAELIIEPDVEVRKPGFFSRRRVVTDRLGRVVATHYEEFVMADRNLIVGTPLMLTSKNA